MLGTEDRETATNQESGAPIALDESTRKWRAARHAARLFVDGPWREFGLRFYHYLHFGHLDLRRLRPMRSSLATRGTLVRLWRRLMRAALGSAGNGTQTGGGGDAVVFDDLPQVEPPSRRDKLTGLLSGDAVTLLIAEALERAQPDGQNFSVLSISLDRLETINQVSGREVGDALLVETAQRLLSVAEFGEAAYSASNRFIFVGRPIDEAARGDLATRLSSLLTEPFRIGAGRHHLSLSIGIAEYPGHGEEAHGLLHAANFARKCAKSSGGNVTILCDAAKCDEQRDRFELENELRTAIGAGELRVHYQPKVRMPEGKLVGFEALIRWQHPVRGLLSPGAFLEIAEEVNLMPALTAWLFRRVGSQTRAWIDAGLTPVPIAVNTPPSEFVGRLLTDHLPAYEAYHLPAGLLDIEITESKMIEDMPAFLAAGTALRQRGFKIAMDDFGTGYSSLSGLSRLPITTLKIDQSFTQRLETDRGDRAVAAAIASIARELGLDLVAEGVETQEQLRILLSLGCTIIQGYLTGRPSPPDEAGKLLVPAPISGAKPTGRRYFRFERRPSSRQRDVGTAFASGPASPASAIKD
jgi:diguanylate cyclase (GGDEF)-like protein